MAKAVKDAKTFEVGFTIHGYINIKAKTEKSVRKQFNNMECSALCLNAKSLDQNVESMEQLELNNA